MAVGGALSLPQDMKTAPYDAPLDLSEAQDPGQSEWQSVISSLGGLEATRVIRVAQLEPLPTDRYVYDAEMQDIVARLEALDAELDASEASWRRAPDMDNALDVRPATVRAAQAPGGVSLVAIASSAVVSPTAFPDEPPVRVYESRASSEGERPSLALVPIVAPGGG